VDVERVIDPVDPARKLLDAEFQSEIARRCRGSGEREGVQVGGSEDVAYRDRDRIVWAINRPHAIARGWAPLVE
jgi:hypothetical protein